MGLCIQRANSHKGATYLLELLILVLAELLEDLVGQLRRDAGHILGRLLEAGTYTVPALYREHKVCHYHGDKPFVLHVRVTRWLTQSRSCTVGSGISYEFDERTCGSLLGLDRRRGTVLGPVVGVVVGARSRRAGGGRAVVGQRLATWCDDVAVILARVHRQGLCMFINATDRRLSGKGLRPLNAY